MEDALQTIWWLTIVKVIIGSGLGLVLVGSLYKFKKIIMTTFGLLLLSNLVTLYLIIGVLSWPLK